MMNSEDVVPPLAANMSAAFKKVRGAIGASDPVLTDLIVTRIVELAKAGVYDIEELSSRTQPKVGKVMRSALSATTMSGRCTIKGQWTVHQLMITYRVRLAVRGRA
jgi:hypothetical protein